MTRSFAERYGPWAVVAGASEGLGAAFARALASRGLNLLLVARRAALLDSLAAELRAKHPSLEIRPHPMDLSRPDLEQALAPAIAGLEVGLGVYNAAFAPLGAFLDKPLADALRAVDVNCRAPVTFAHALCGLMAARGRGGLVLMSSLAGLQGTASLAAYSATKSFNRCLAEALWKELAPRGVDVLASCAGAILTPGFEKASQHPAPGTLPAAEVAERTLRALGRGPTFVPGALNGVAAFVMGRLLPRKLAIGIMASTTASVVPPPGPAAG
jgi:short-subunit dehydrogenase